MRPKLLSLATAVPEHVLKTEDVIVEAGKIFGGRHEDFERMMPVYANSGIHTRYSSLPYEWFREDKGWPERSEAFLVGASKIFAGVSALALERAGLEPIRIRSVISYASC